MDACGYVGTNNWRVLFRWGFGLGIESRYGSWIPREGRAPITFSYLILIFLARFFDVQARAQIIFSPFDLGRAGDVSR